MSLQYISDSTGKTTGVFIPIQDWNKIKKKYDGIEQSQLQIPEWHKNEIDSRIKGYIKDPTKALDFDAAMDDIEKIL